MNSLDIARQGKSAARQLRAQARAGVLTDREFDRLMAKVEAGFEQMIPTPSSIAPAVEASFRVIDGGRP